MLTAEEANRISGKKLILTTPESSDINHVLKKIQFAAELGETKVDCDFTLDNRVIITLFDLGYEVKDRLQAYYGKLEKWELKRVHTISWKNFYLRSKLNLDDLHE